MIRTTTAGHNDDLNYLTAIVLLHPRVTDSEHYWSAYGGLEQYPKVVNWSDTDGVATQWNCIFELFTCYLWHLWICFTTLHQTFQFFPGSQFALFLPPFVVSFVFYCTFSHISNRQNGRSLAQISQLLSSVAHHQERRIIFLEIVDTFSHLLPWLRWENFHLFLFSTKL